MEQRQEEKALYYFRIKTEWTAANEVGALDKTKTEELVVAANYTDAEKTAYAIAEDQNRYEFGSVNIEIIKTKIDDVKFNDVLCQDEGMLNGLICNYFEEEAESGVGLYAVTVATYTKHETTGKVKGTKSTVYTPALSSTDAVKRITKLMGESPVDYVVRDVKFDNAAAIYWPSDIHQSKTKEFDLQ